MLLLTWKRLSGSYFAFVVASRRRLRPKALSTPTSLVSPSIPVKLRYVEPLPKLLSSPPTVSNPSQVGTVLVGIVPVAVNRNHVRRRSLSER